LKRLLAQGAELAGQGNGQPDRNFRLDAHTLTRGNLCVQVVQHPVDDNPGNRDVEPERERPTSDSLVTLESSAPCPV
jgi:hypothetical protein